MLLGFACTAAPCRESGQGETHQWCGPSLNHTKCAISVGMRREDIREDVGTPSEDLQYPGSEIARQSGGRKSPVHPESCCGILRAKADGLYVRAAFLVAKPGGAHDGVERTSAQQMRRFARLGRFVRNKTPARTRAPFERDDEEAWLRRAVQGTEPSGAMDLGTSWLTHAPVHPLQQTLKDLEGAMPTSEVAQGRRRNAMPEAAVARNTSARKFPGRHLPRCQNSRRRLSIRGGRRGRKPIGPDSGARPDGFVIATGLRTRYRMAKKCPGFKGEHPGLQGIPGQATRVTRSGRRSGQGLCVLLT